MKKEPSSFRLNLCEDVEVPELQEVLDFNIKNEEKRDATKLPLLLHLRWSTSYIKRQTSEIKSSAVNQMKYEEHKYYRLQSVAS